MEMIMSQTLTKLMSTFNNEEDDDESSNEEGGVTYHNITDHLDEGTDDEDYDLPSRQLVRRKELNTKSLDF